MPSGHIRFATDILRRLGEELNPHVDQGLIELAKNAYDADARKCVIELEGTDAPGGRIRVADDGDGMTLDEIRNGWLVLGQSVKSAAKRTRLGRIPAGNKGLGRLAALRLGSAVTLVSRPRSSPSRQYRVGIEWERFERVRLVEDVSLPIVAETRRRRASGVELAIDDVSTRIGRMDVKRLARALVLLADPFAEDPTAFSPQLRVPEFADLEQLVSSRYFEHAEYHLQASVDSAGYVSARTVDWRGNVLFEGEHGDVAIDRKGSTYSCPPAEVDVWIFLLSADAFRLRPVSVGEVREWLGAFGGVHLYLNGLRVSPYGNPGNDWLDLNLRRAQAPEERPSTNTLIGRVAVVDTADSLLQKTDRTGLIETEAFTELRAFVQDTMEWLARRRMSVAQARRQRQRKEATKETGKAREQVEQAISKTSGKAKTDLQKAFHQYDRTREREAEVLRKEIQLYRTLSTAGITAATFAHESQGNPVKVLHQSISAIERRGKRYMPKQYDGQLAQPVERVKSATASLSFLSSSTLSLIEHQKRRVGRVDLHPVLRRVIKTFRPFFRGRDATIRFKPVHANPYLRGTEAGFESIVANLLNNSLVAFESGGVEDRLVVVETDVVQDLFVLEVGDSGPGIEGISLRDIWLPGQTTRPNGTGLGLAIVRDAVSDLGGAVGVSESGPLGGAVIRVELPILGS